uniref:PD-(D/E)XK endonuclease-like domain-containing protein n=1 Tax=viral metagenome TaxID=1070528 RepID=A0A6C0LZV4_9ZZZZ
MTYYPQKLIVKQCSNTAIHTMTDLASKNPHERDARITFEPVEHKYTIDADPGTAYTSVTTWVHSHFREFDSDAIIQRMMASRNWKASPYYGMTADAIKAAWDTNRDAAAAAGTAMHYNIECHYNGLNVPDEDANSPEFRYFLQFVQDHATTLRPYRTEWTVFDESVRISGSIDMVFENLDPATGSPDGTLSIYDWKRCKEIKKVPFGADEYSPNPVIAHIPDTNYWHYCLQLNTYKAVLERCYGKRVTDLFLVCLHPDNKNGSYQCIRVADLQAEVRALFEAKKNETNPK